MAGSEARTSGGVDMLEATDPQQEDGSPAKTGSASGGGANRSAAPQKMSLDAVIGHVVWLMMQTRAYRHVFLADLEWMVMPPLLLNQYHLFRDKNRIVAFAAWAYLSEEAEARLQGGNPRLTPADWKGGDRLWLIHLFDPFNGSTWRQEAALAELQEKTALRGKSFKFHRRGADGAATVVTIPGDARA
jgi:cytolysin-activating lysine-acyltransferase